MLECAYTDCPCFLCFGEQPGDRLHTHCPCCGCCGGGGGGGCGKSACFLGDHKGSVRLHKGRTQAPFHRAAIGSGGSIVGPPPSPPHETRRSTTEKGAPHAGMNTVAPPMNVTVYRTVNGMKPPHSCRYRFTEQTEGVGFQVGAEEDRRFFIRNSNATASSSACPPKRCCQRNQLTFPPSHGAHTPRGFSFHPPDPSRDVCSRFLSAFYLSLPLTHFWAPLPPCLFSSHATLVSCASLLLCSGGDFPARSQRGRFGTCCHREENGSNGHAPNGLTGQSNTCFTRSDKHARVQTTPQGTSSSHDVMMMLGDKIHVKGDVTRESRSCALSLCLHHRERERTLSQKHHIQTHHIRSLSLCVCVCVFVRGRDSAHSNGQYTNLLCED